MLDMMHELCNHVGVPWNEWKIRVLNTTNDMKKESEQFEQSNMRVDTFRELYIGNTEFDILMQRHIERKNQYSVEPIKQIEKKMKEIKKKLTETINSDKEYENLSKDVIDDLNEGLRIIHSCKCNVCSYYKLINPKRWESMNEKQWLTHLRFHNSKNTFEKRRFMLHCFQNNILKPNGAKMYDTAIADSVWVGFYEYTCYRVFQFINGIGMNSIKNYYRSFQKKLKLMQLCWCPADLQKMELINKLPIPDSNRKIMVQQWWLYWLSLVGDWEPNLMKVRIPVQSRTQLFEHDFKLWVCEFGWDTKSDFVSENYWLHVLYEMQTKFNINWSDKRRFTICKDCSKIHKLMIQCKTFADREKVHFLKCCHLEQIKIVRHHILSLEIESMQCPGRSVLVVADSMDQSVLNFPFFQRMSKEHQNNCLTSTYKVWLTNFLSTRKPKYSFFLKNDQTGKGGNESITCLWWWLVLTIQNTIKQDSWPRKLFLVLDNGPEFKNEYFILFLHIFVIFGFFREIEVIFLPVGHTHWKCDQCFSCIRQWILSQTSGITVLSKFINYLTEYDNHQSKVHFLDNLYDSKLIRSLIQRLYGTNYAKFKFDGGITNYSNFIIKLADNNNDMTNNKVLTICNGHSLNQNDFTHLTQKKSFLYFNEKIKTMKNYFTNHPNNEMREMYDIMVNNLNPTNIKHHVCLTEWPKLSKLEKMLATPQTVLKDLNIAKIQSYVKEFTIKDSQQKEWDYLLEQVESLQKEQCSICQIYMKEFTNDKSFYKIIANKQIPNTKNETKKFFVEHLETNNFHLSECNPNNHMFKLLRGAKRKLQETLRVTMTTAKSEFKNKDQNLGFDDFTELSGRDEENIRYKMFEKANMFMGSFQLTIKILNLKDDFEKFINTKIKDDFSDVSAKIQQQFVVSCFKKYEKYHTRPKIQEPPLIHFSQAEISDLITLKSFAVFDFEQYDDVNHLFILENNFKNEISDHPWVLFYSLGNNESLTKKYQIGVFLFPVVGYSFKGIWKFQKMNNQNKEMKNERQRNLTKLNHNDFFKKNSQAIDLAAHCHLVNLYDYLHDELNEDVPSLFFPSINGDKYLKIYSNPEHLRLLEFLPQTINYLKQSFFRTISLFYDQEYEQKMFCNQSLINTWFMESFCSHEGPTALSLPPNVFLSDKT